MSTTTGITTDAERGMNHPLAWNTTSSAIVRLGSALFTIHMITSRATTPGAVTRLVNSVLAAATMGRTMRWVNSRLVLTLDVQPNDHCDDEQQGRAEACAGIGDDEHGAADRPGGQEDDGLRADEVDGGAPLARRRARLRPRTSAATV